MWSTSFPFKRNFETVNKPLRYFLIVGCNINMFFYFFLQGVLWERFVVTSQHKQARKQMAAKDNLKIHWPFTSITRHRELKSKVQETIYRATSFFRHDFSGLLTITDAIWKSPRKKSIKKLFNNYSLISFSGLVTSAIIFFSEFFTW